MQQKMQGFFAYCILKGKYGKIKDSFKWTAVFYVWGEKDVRFCCCKSRKAYGRTEKAVGQIVSVLSAAVICPELVCVAFEGFNIAFLRNGSAYKPLFIEIKVWKSVNMLVCTEILSYKVGGLFVLLYVVKTGFIRAMHEADVRDSLFVCVFLQGTAELLQEILQSSGESERLLQQMIKENGLEDYKVVSVDRE